MKTFNEYQQFTQSLAAYNESGWLHKVKIGERVDQIVGMPWLYPAFALSEEAGEVAGKIAKFIRKSGTESDYSKLREDVKKELGDVAYQLSETARQFGWTLQDVIDGNVEKLSDRKKRGVLIGEGDDR
jgi:NTP pyrophosphatase (non-canonical NTP hydrolase)